MLFTSLQFFVFLPVTIIVFALVPARWRWGWLLVASYVFYAAGDPSHTIYLAVVTAIVFGCSRAIAEAERPAVRVTSLTLGLFVVLGGLFAFKFYDFLAGEIEQALGLVAEADAAAPVLPRLGLTTPVGFSFYAFAAASYLIDIFAGRIAAERNAGRVALYVAHFPKILAGPIERATTFLPQVAAGLRFDSALVAPGLQLIGWGLFKKVVIADTLAPMVDRAFSTPAYASPVDLLVAVYLFSFQIYCDFSGYADIAIGVSLLFGIRLMENFRRPYLSRSTAEFWGGRWHISLGRWFRDYLYIPLGGSRSGAVQRYANIMGVFVVSGLWHAGLGYGVGWTFLVWGALNGFYQWVGLATAGLWRCIGTRLPRLGSSAAVQVLRILLTFHLIALGWVFFRAATIGDALTILERIWAGLARMPALLPAYPFTADHGLAAGLIAFLMLVEVLDERRSIWERLAAAPVALRWAAYYAGIFALLLIGTWGSREFIYMQF
jgi:D-alanyl-lipoteichoic acid acyltransferase DltB (MBOAT superfamily)